MNQTRLPLVTSHFEPCKGQVTIFPSSLAWCNGPPAWLQVDRMAWKLPSTFATRIFSPSISAPMIFPRGMSATFPTLTLAMLHLGGSEEDGSQAFRQVCGVRRVEPRAALSDEERRRSGRAEREHPTGVQRAIFGLR